MCGRAIRCITRTFCDTVCDAITHFACRVPIYSCVGAIFNQIAGCCINLWHAHNADGPHAIAAIPIALPVAHAVEPVLLPITGASDQPHDELI